MSSPWWLLLQPKNWLMAPVLGLLRLATLLPYAWQMRFGQALGELIHLLDRKGKQSARTNLQFCFPRWSQAEREILLKKNYRSIGMSILETALAWFGHDHQMPPLTIHGLEHWQHLYQQKKGILLISAHLSSLEIVGRLLQPYLTIQAVYRPQKLALLDAFAKYYRLRHFSKIIARHDLRELIRSLQHGESVWYTPDIDAGLKNSVFVPFFGVLAATITTPPRLVKRGNAVGMTIFFYRKDDLSGYELFLSPALENFPSGNDEADANRINLLIEQAILKKPEQYLWQYKRFKTRPPGEKRLYLDTTRNTTNE